MKKMTLLLGVLLILTAQAQDKPVNGNYAGKYCSGTGDSDFLRLIDESFAFFHANPIVPNLTMIYKADWNTFAEGAGWGAWWIQNSYGFSYSATPFLEDPWITILQNSWDLFWDNQGDGIRKGLWGDGSPNKLSELVAPDGGLGDTAAPGKIIYKQGDGDVKMHDWFYEATAACLVMQSEILLVNRDKNALTYYLPKMERACNFIERARDSKNNLFLVGPACNLLAPSYGGVKLPDGTFGKGYLAGVSITYLAALDRMVELYKMNGDREKQKLFEKRQKLTRESLPLLMTDKGYFVKSVEPDGIKHGVLGQKQFGYLEGVANADAVALRVADQQTAENIYRQIADFPEIRPFNFLLTNAPGLDDTYGGWGRTSGKGLQGFWKFGDWVNGGVWGTVEGRAILMYYRLGKFDDIRRSTTRAMKWAKDFRMDAPWSQQGENTNNPWSDSGKFRVGGVAVMVDNFAIPAATIRGLFDYEYKADQLILRPRIPGSITQYTQNQPIRFGTKKIYLSCINDGPKIKSVSLNGIRMQLKSTNEIVLNFNALPQESKIEIRTEGGWMVEETTSEYPQIPKLVPDERPGVNSLAELPQSLKKPYEILLSVRNKIPNQYPASFEISFLNEAIKSINDCRVRPNITVGEGYYRPLTKERIEGINNFYEQAALSMYKGFEKIMADCETKGDIWQKQLAAIYLEAKK
ncbi:hypothetical protein OU798_22740 [Prolixibacteraceae bacterium Z1-6]|uniref:Uncharacterized protein n=1 Tax=Draconibacterium aestuarii TaxID=2998507 RepID=A0A9X3F9S7_9BACT|nr:hypothetical protein [Prolixibacteraceae bacterium Z1-6]